MAANKNRFPVLSRLKRAIQKVKFLLSFNATKWIASCLKSSSSGSRQLSFEAQPSLLDCTDDYREVGLSFTLSRTASSVSRTASPVSRTTSPESGISRSISDASSGDDIDQRAGRFIENFRRQLWMERQISLQLRYCREDSLGSSVSD